MKPLTNHYRHIPSNPDLPDIIEAVIVLVGIVVGLIALKWILG